MRAFPVLLLAAACNGDNDGAGTGPAPSCDDIVADPLGSVPVDDWPPGVAEGLGVYNGLGGRYDTTSSCGGTIAVKLVPKPQEELDIVTRSWTATTLPCGCVTDPKYADDTAYPVAALVHEFEFFVEVFGEPGVDGQNIVGEGALYQPGAPMSFRQCGAKDVNPILGSVYEQVTTVLRHEGGYLTGALGLARTDGTNETCDLTDWELVEALPP